MNFADSVIDLYIAELVLNCFLGYVVSCVAAKHTMWTSDYITYCFELIHRLCKLFCSIELVLSQLFGNEKSARSFSARSFFVDVRAACPCENACFFPVGVPQMGVKEMGV